MMKYLKPALLMLKNKVNATRGTERELISKQQGEELNSILSNKIKEYYGKYQKWVIFVRYENGHDMPECQARLLASLDKLGWLIWVVDNSELAMDDEWQKKCCCKIYWQRKNQGMCIGAYADAISILSKISKHYPELKAPSLALINNSFFPMQDAEANKILKKMFTKPLDADTIRGLTETREQAYHLQSYLLIIGSLGWLGPKAAQFWEQCRDLNGRENIIAHGEVKLTGILKQAGLRTEVMMPMSKLASMAEHCVGVQDHHPVSPAEHNPYLVYWRELLRLTGIIKKSALNNASQSKTAGASLSEFIRVSREAELMGGEEIIDQLIRR